MKSRCSGSCSIALLCCRSATHHSSVSSKRSREYVGSLMNGDAHHCSAPLPDRIPLLRKGTRPFLGMLALVERPDGGDLLALDQIEGFLDGEVSGLADDLLDRGEDQRRAIGEQIGEGAGPDQQGICWHHLVDQAPAPGLLGVHPAAG